MLIQGTGTEFAYKNIGRSELDMGSEIFISASGCISMVNALNMIANNIANADTSGFKRDIPSFSSQLESSWRSSYSMKQLPMSKFEGGNIDFTEGPIRITGNHLDFALQGKGFFVIKTPQGILYTRNGSFKLNSRRELVTSDGFNVMGQKGPIKVPAKGIECDLNGVLRSEGKEIERFQIVEFSAFSSLEKVGNSLFRSKGEPKLSSNPIRTTVHQGKLEQSNVNIVKEITGIIETLRAFESHQKAILALDEVSQKTVNEVGRL
jgi:flagellar basal-body rod protein FlgG